MKKLVFTVFAVGLGLTASIMAQVPSYVPTNGLVGWWPFNGNANDESGNGNNGTVNGATLTTDRFGNTGSSYKFTYNGWIPGQQKDEIYIPYNTIFNSSSLTVSIWINPSQVTYNNGEAYFIARFENGYSNPNGQVWAFAMTPNNSLLAGINQASTSNSQTNTVVFGDPINLNNWVNVIFTYDGSVLKIFQNGSLVSIQNNAIQINTLSNSGISIGVSRQANGWWFPFDGKIDDVGIWNRALTQQEITALYGSNSCSNDLTISPILNTQNIGGNASFTATSTDSNPTFIWQSDLGQGFQTLTDVGSYSGTNTNALTISNVQLANHNNPIRVISTSGNCIDTSVVAVLTISNTCTSNVTIYDTVTVNETIYDTLTTNITVYDTLTTNVYDTTYITVSDTLLTTVTDTLIINTTLSLPAPNNENTILIYPNPASDHITIDNGNFAAMAGYSIKIENNAGQQVFQSAINQAQFYVDLSTWTGNGLYFVYLIDAQNNTVTLRKIVLQ